MIAEAIAAFVATSGATIYLKIAGVGASLLVTLVSMHYKKYH